MNEDTPARKAMAYCFCGDLPGRKGNRVTIASALSNEYKASFGTPINTLNAYSKLVEDARDRALWRECVDTFVNDQRVIYESKVQRKAERRQEAKHKREADKLERATSGRRRRVQFIAMHVTYVFSFVYVSTKSTFRVLLCGVMIGEVIYVCKCIRSVCCLI